jgi:hypothetical protein
MALAEGLPEAMAAVAIGSPYLTSAAGTAVRDVRSIAGLPLDVYSGPAIAAFAWELALKVSGVDPAGAPDTWKNINAASINSFCTLVYESATEEGMDFATYRDPPSLFTQLSLMSSGFSDVLTDDAVAQAALPFFGEIWPRPKEGPLSRFAVDWGSNPDSGKAAIPGFPLRMSDAALDAGGQFSNLTAKENLTAKLALTKDTAYWLSVASAPSLPSGASIEVRIVEHSYNSDKKATFDETLPALFFGPSHPSPQRVVLKGKPDGSIYHMLHFSLRSPAVRVPDTQINVRLDPAY